jgi:ketosteroid isomerase-like protein
MAKKKRAPKKKKSSKKRAAPKRAKKGGAKKRPAAESLESLARKIVRMTQKPDFAPSDLSKLYTEDCTSQEASGQIALGLDGLEDKLKHWEQMQTGTTWKATNVWVGPTTICIEWDATVNTRDGRTVSLREVAVHEIKDGKIQRERFYYNPMDLAPPQGAGGA